MCGCLPETDVYKRQIMNIVRAKMEAKGKPLAEPAGCLSGDCSGCSQAAHCSGKATVKADAAGKEE